MTTSKSTQATAVDPSGCVHLFVHATGRLMVELGALNPYGVLISHGFHMRQLIVARALAIFAVTAHRFIITGTTTTIA